jgi:4-hydroxybenzoate polyprenyltransferase
MRSGRAPASLETTVAPRITLRTLLDLGRVSNLPTVWTNVLGGTVLSGGRLDPLSLGCLGLGASFFYVGGMFLNDAFDREFDAKHRRERPIPSGRATAAKVFATGFLLLGAGLGLVATAGALAAGSRSLLPWRPLAAGTALAGLIVFYDAFHKGHSYGPVVMGLCRAALYLLAASTLGHLGGPVVVGALLLLAYVVGLTAVARKEARNPRLRGVVGPLIAGISILDAALIALAGPAWLAAVAALGFPLTLAAQRYVKGT